jgi:hypothetical protein
LHGLGEVGSGDLTPSGEGAGAMRAAGGFAFGIEKMEEVGDLVVNGQKFLRLPRRSRRLVG